jgi:2-dehydro-3-deoxy-D-arabinonate dehydratase
MPSCLALNKTAADPLGEAAMQLAKIKLDTGPLAVVAIEEMQAHVLNFGLSKGPKTLAELLASPEPISVIRSLYTGNTLPMEGLHYLAPIDQQEVWAAGVTYKRSKVAREEESVGAAQFYDKVYSAPRPELFLKATPKRVVGPLDEIRVRADSKWSVPEPELTLVVSPDLRIVGYTIGNDVSSRDIEGENPLYLPQAKVYHKSCSLGPVITLASEMPPLEEVNIQLVIKRGGQVVFTGETSISQMARTTESLVEWLGKENHFPDGVLLMTGTGIVPPDSFNLAPGDTVEIRISGIGTLVNPVGL